MHSFGTLCLATLRSIYNMVDYCFIVKVFHFY